jgi:uncharacterized phage protein (TIGR01671 family)
MRTIKFRLWHKDGKMLYEDTIGDCLQWYREKQGTELMQFTGLLDKNGKPIYEGDVVAKFSFDDPSFRNEVIYRNGAFGYLTPDEAFHSFANNYHFDWKNCQSEKIEVIGNIHQTPELLEVQ